MDLWHLSTFELQEILGYLSSSEIGRLLLCGNRTLCKKLTTSTAVTKLDLDLGRFPSIDIWSSFVLQFRYLSELRITNDENYRRRPLFVSQLRALPQKMRILSFDDRLAFRAFLQLHRSDPLRFESLTYLKLAVPRNPPVGAHQTLWPSNLELLHFNGHFYAPLDLKTLPLPLKHFSGSFAHILDIESSTRFPGTLESLTLVLKNSPPPLAVIEKISHLSNLTALSLNCVKGYTSMGMIPAMRELGEKVFPLLPRSLTHLELPLAKKSANGFHLLPPNIKLARGCLSRMLAAPLLENMPRSLTHLSGSVPLLHLSSVIERWPTEKTDEQDVLQSEGIKTLRIGRYSFTQPASPSGAIHIPSSVTKLTLDDSVPISTEHQRSIQKSIILPASLTSLKVRDGYPLSNTTLLVGLPNKLKVLTNTTGIKSIDESILRLPPSLTVLSTIDPHSQFGIPTPTLSSLWLPRGLIKLEIGPLQLSSLKWINGLPQTLERLRITIHPLNTWTIPPIEAVEVKFPPKLFSLDLSLGERVEGCHNLFAMMPKNLNTLKLHNALVGKIQDEHFAFLPKELSRLLISPNEAITSECLPYVPPYLYHLTIFGRTPDWWTNMLEREVTKFTSEYDSDCAILSHF